MRDAWVQVEKSAKYTMHTEKISIRSTVKSFGLFFFMLWILSFKFQEFLIYFQWITNGRTSSLSVVPKWENIHSLNSLSNCNRAFRLMVKLIVSLVFSIFHSFFLFFLMDPGSHNSIFFLFCLFVLYWIKVKKSFSGIESYDQWNEEKIQNMIHYY